MLISLPFFNMESSKKVQNFRKFLLHSPFIRIVRTYFHNDYKVSDSYYSYLKKLGFIFWVDSELNTDILKNQTFSINLTGKNQIHVILIYLELKLHFDWQRKLSYINIKSMTSYTAFKKCFVKLHSTETCWYIWNS